MKIAQIGTGGWGKNHTRVLSQLGKLACVCDLDIERSQMYGEMYNVNSYTSTETMLKEENFDAVVICTPTSTHFEVAAHMIKEGKHVFVEKPMTYLPSEGEELVELAKDNNVLLTSGYIERFNPAVSYVKEFVKEKKYGELLMLEFRRENRMPLHIKDVGIIYDTSVHDIDTALWLFDEKPEMVYAKAGRIRHDHEDFAAIMLSFKNNRVATLLSNWITPTRLRTFDAVFTDARIFSDFITQDVRIESEEGTSEPKREKAEPLMLELQNFVDSIEGRANLVVKAEEALNVTKIADAAIRSVKNGNPVYLDDL